MNPTLEVQITARLDKLDAALKVAEAKIGASAVTMGKTGEQGGSMFVDKLAGNMAKGLAMGAISNVLGGGILTALQGINAGKSGEQIGLDISKGIIDGAKSIPVVGQVVSILDELINGMDRVAEAASDRAADIGNAFREAFQIVAKSSEDMAKTVTRKTEDMAAKNDPKQQANLSAQRLIEDANAQLKKIDDDKQMLRDAAAAKEKASIVAATAEIDAQRFVTTDVKTGRENDDRLNKILGEQKKQFESSRLAEEQQIGKQGVDLIKALNEQILQAEKTGAADQAKIQQDKVAKAAATAKSLQEINIKAAIDSGDYQGAQKQIDAQAAAEQKALDEKSRKTTMSANEYALALKEINAKAAAEQKALDEKSLKDAKEIGDQMVADFKEQQKEKYDAAIQAQQDIIDGEQAAQEQIDKIGRVDQMAAQAAQSMIGSGQTALGQFNFAQSGAGNQAITLAQKQVTSLEKIEAATAEQVRLQKEMGAFR